MRGVNFKNMKGQAARLYDRAAFVCGREPNFGLPEEEKRELQKFKREDIFETTRHAITNKKHKRLGTGSTKKLSVSSLQIDNIDFKQRFICLPVQEDIDPSIT